MRAGNLSEEQLKTIKSVDKVRKEQRKQTIESDPGTYGTLLAGGDSSPSVLEKAQKRQDIIQYILVLATDLVTGTQDLMLDQPSTDRGLQMCRSSQTPY